MNFSEALISLKDGEALQREGWNGSGMELRSKNPQFSSDMSHSYLYMVVPDCEEGIRRIPWQPAQVDLFANDWSIVSEV